MEEKTLKQASCETNVLYMMSLAMDLILRNNEWLMSRLRQSFRKDKKQRTISSAVAAASVALICVGMYGYMIENNYNGVNPYQTIFGNAVWEDPAKK